MPRASKKNQRQSHEYETIELRFRPAQLRRIKQAAGIKGMSVTDFIISTADPAAIEIIESSGSWVLGERDSEIFVSALLNPPEPDSRMIAAFRSHKARVESV
jgi:uncharacterized protein (DUF1778 family)